MNRSAVFNTRTYSFEILLSSQVHGKPPVIREDYHSASSGVVEPPSLSPLTQIIDRLDAVVAKIERVHARTAVPETETEASRCGRPCERSSAS